MRRALLLSLVAFVGLLPGAAGGSRLGDSGELVEVVVTLSAPPLSHARASARSLAAEQRTVERRILTAIPAARIRWRYRITLNGFAVVVPRAELARLERVPGIARVWPNTQFRRHVDRTASTIAAPQAWTNRLGAAGDGIKIGIIDDGIDQKHPFFSPAGFSYPKGFPKGQKAYTTPKVIVARAFAPPPLTPASPRSKYEAKPFDPKHSFHGTHVAGIAAGDAGVQASVRGRKLTLAGVAPRAYLGNYKAIGVLTSTGDLVDNAAELTAAIEAAVADGMDVINLSLGEQEIDPSRNVVVQAIDGAADAGVVPVLAAGNDFAEFGSGSVGSPATAAKAIAVAAASSSDVIADFSSAGPTPVTLQLKPEVTAPGVGVVSSLPTGQGMWTSLSGTSMASPYVAGAAALLRERHPTWTVAQIKSALVQTGQPVYEDEGHRSETPALREGGGLVDLALADAPLLFADPVAVSLGLLAPGQSVTKSVALTDAGGGAGAWTVSLVQQVSDPGVSLAVPAAVTVPGTLDLTATAAANADGRDVTGFVVLSRGADTRRIPYWVSVSARALASEPHGTLARAGVYRGNTSGKPALVSTYRYPRGNTRLSGPEQVFRVTITRPVANFGVAILSGFKGLEPRVVFAGDESHLVGYAGLPFDFNPYTARYFAPLPVAGALRPSPGTYDIVFDSTGAAGPFTFRFWIDDHTPPKLRLLTPHPKAGSSLVVSATDAGSGVDRATITVEIDGARRLTELAGDRIRVSLGGLSRGRHTLRVVASDRQEAKNNENVPLVFPNTAVLRTGFVLR